MATYRKSIKYIEINSNRNTIWNNISHFADIKMFQCRLIFKSETILEAKPCVYRPAKYFESVAKLKKKRNNLYIASYIDSTISSLKFTRSSLQEFYTVALGRPIWFFSKSNKKIKKKISSMSNVLWFRYWFRFFSFLLFWREYLW